MLELLVLGLLVWLGVAAYGHGKRIGSRQGYGVGRNHSRRK
jgi:hypothetical protein